MSDILLTFVLLTLTARRHWNVTEGSGAQLTDTCAASSWHRLLKETNTPHSAPCLRGDRTLTRENGPTRCYSWPFSKKGKHTYAHVDHSSCEILTNSTAKGP